MIEMVYKGTEKGKEEDRLKLPKNVRQIGEITKGSKVYLEDYADTYLHQVEMAILLGEVKMQGGSRYIFIQGAIEVEGGILNDEAWETIYRDAKKYFEDSEILGWAEEVPEQPLTLTKEMDAVYKEHFKREGAVLLLHEPTEKEDNLFAEENGALKKQNGYYIYYDKNKAMQEYMVAKNVGKSVEKETQVSDKAIRSFRKLAEDKKAKKEAKEETKTNPVPENKKTEDKQPRTTRFLYTASTLLVLTILVIGVTMINNYDKIKSMENTLADIVGSTEKALEANAVNNINSEDDEAWGKKSTEPTETETETRLTEEQTKATETETETTAVETEEQAKLPENQAEQSENQTEQPETQAGRQDEAQAASAAINRAAQSSYVVKAGDTLADICRMYYGSAERLEEICQLNGISDPNTILLGQKILLP